MQSTLRGGPSDIYDTDRRTKLTALETISRPLTFTQKTKKSLLPFRALKGNVRTPSMARWKARCRLYIRCNWTFSLSPAVERLRAEIGRSRRFSKGGGHLSADFRGKRASPTNRCWYQSSRLIALSCAIKISAVRHLVLSQSTRVTDRQTGTDRETDGQNYDS